MMNYLFFIGTAFLLFMSFRIVRLVSHRIGSFQKFYPFIVGLELGLWIAFLFWVVNYFLSYKTYYKELVLVLVVTSVVLLVWYYFKDVVAGFIFRIKHNPKNGQGLQSSEGDGIIKKLAPSQVFVEAEGGNIIRIPYSLLLGKSLTIDSGDTHAASEAVFFMEVDHIKDYTTLEQKIKMSLLQSPWCVPGKPIRIEFLSKPSSGVEVALHLVDRSYAEAAKSKLKSLLLIAD